MSLQVTILGCGSSGGVPRVGDHWGACDPANPKNRRRRCSLLVERHGAGGETGVLVDTSPDLRQQLLDAGTGWVDGVLYTHGRRRVDVYFDEATAKLLRSRFAYCFESPAGSDYPPILRGHEIVAGETVKIGGAGGAIEALPFRQMHGSGETLGFRFGGLAYSPDVSDLPEESLKALHDLDVWIIDALRPAPHPSHFSVEQALARIARVKPKRAVLTHMHVDLDYATLARELPQGVEPAYDGMVLTTERRGSRSRLSGPSR